MTLPIRLISTDFDGTIFAESESPPVSPPLQTLIGDLQRRGVKWAINTGRDMDSLMEALAQAELAIQPDFLVLVEREIHLYNGSGYVGLDAWNDQCARSHEALFDRVRLDLPQLCTWISARFNATIYEDPYSPFCLIAGNSGDAESIHAYLDDYCRGIPHLSVMRNDVYARFCHDAYNKGTALAELTRRLGLGPAQVFAAGDHLNDLPMLSSQYARWLAAPRNAIDSVKTAVQNQTGYVSQLPHGHGVAEALIFHLQNAGA
jgi:hydroxymethylpyrimidine pyrophosphatase-like HAD family hydrolase